MDLIEKIRDLARRDYNGDFAKAADAYFHDHPDYYQDRATEVEKRAEDDREYHFRAARKAAKIKGFTFHDLRHCCITRWAAAGVPTAAAMLAAGHSSVASHKRYQNLTKADLKAGFGVFTARSQGKQEKKESAAS